MTLETAACPLCGGSDFAPVYPGTIQNPEAEAADYFASSRRHAGYWPVVRCRACGLALANPRDDTATRTRVYAQLSDAAYDTEAGNRRRTARAYLKFMRRAGAGAGVLVDVGCATGVFACEAQASGWQVTGVEPSAWALSQARACGPGVNWITATLEESEFAPASVDAVTMWDVLEHLPRPIAALSHVRAWLKPGGRLFLNVPNMESGVARLLGPRWMLLLREHLWYFTPRTLRLALQAAGFAMDLTQANRVHFSLANVAVRLGQYPGGLGAAARTAARVPGLRRVSVAFPIGDMMVAAQTHLCLSRPIS
jgi:2-polyprenyl-3-methyl-5-hydroxy-6-metoxy-1,4-benzoquinol methylase